MATRLRVATVGAGYFAAFHHDAWAQNEDVEFVAIIDTDLAAAQAAASKHQRLASDNLELVLAEQNLDLLDIATPPASHLDLVQLAAAHPLTMICQKPLADDLATAKAVVNAAGGNLLVVHENFRFQPWYREIKRLIDAGQFGRLHNIAFRLRPGDGQGSAAYLDRQPYFQAMDRFLVHETAIHFIDTFRYLCGEMTSVYADLRQLNPAITGEDAGQVIFAFENAVRGHFDGNRLNDHVATNPRLTMGEMWLEGEAGVMRLDGDGRLFWKPHGEGEREHLYAWDNIGFGGDCVYRLQAHVVRHLRDGTPLENSARDYLRNLEIEDAIYRSHQEKRQIAL